MAIEKFITKHMAAELLATITVAGRVHDKDDLKRMCRNAGINFSTGKKIKDVCRMVVADMPYDSRVERPGFLALWAAAHESAHVEVPPLNL